MTQKNILSKIKLNWKSALTVAMVTLPLSIAISVASGGTPTQGVITSVWATFIAGIFGGSHYNILGVAGALTTILLAFSLEYGFSFLPLVAITSGLIILFIYILKFEKYLVYVPSSVMYGFAGGVAIQIAITQINDALGLSLPKTESILHSLEQTFSNLDKVNTVSLIIFVITFSTLFILKKIKSPIPGVIPVSVFGILFGLYANISTNLNQVVISLEEKLKSSIDFKLIDFVNLNNIRETLSNTDLLGAVISISIIIAIISILETLITAKIADKITNTRFNSRKEMLGLALSNIFSGLFGGLPATGVFIRTGLNVRSGATNKMSQFLVSIMTVILAVLFLGYFKYVPVAIIAGILFNTALGLIEMDKFQRYWKDDKTSLFVAILVIIIVVFRDASFGIIVGIAVALLVFVDKLSKGEFEAVFNENKKIIECEHGSCFIVPNNNVDNIVYSIEGIMVYLDSEAHLHNFQKMVEMPHLKNVVIRMRDTFYMDLDGLDILDESVQMLHNKGITVLFTKPCTKVLNVMIKSKIFRKKQKEDLIFDKTELALKYLGFTEEEIGAKLDKKEV